MSLRENRARLAREVYPEKHASPDWHKDAETRYELEKLYAEWGLDVRWLRGERSHKVVPPAPSVPIRRRRSRAKSHRVR
jgi:hypothetical protein